MQRKKLLDVMIILLTTSFLYLFSILENKQKLDKNDIQIIFFILRKQTCSVDT